VTASAERRSEMSEENIRKVLKDFGATEKEIEIYIFLAKHGILKGGEIVKATKTHKALVYRILGNLQRKGLVEATLESPARFTSVPFETVLDLSIKAKRDEAAQMERTRKEILNCWKSISKPQLETSMEKFVVIEGNNRIYSKISRMIKETKNQLSVVTTVSGLLRADRFGLFDTVFAHPLRSKIQFRFLTDLSNQNLDAMKTLLKKTPKTKFNLKGRNPDLGIQVAPRMVIRDAEEIIFFMTPRTDTSAAGKDEVCLWTNCKELVNAFTAVFEDSWRNSTDIAKKIIELETGKSPPKTCVINDPQKARKTYEETINSAKEEILILTSSKGLIAQNENISLVKEWVKRGVSVRIMAPIMTENLKAALQLSKYCAVKHVAATHLGTTVVDGDHLFQFKTSTQEQEKLDTEAHFADTFYTSDRDYVEKTKNMLNEIWENAPVPTGGMLQAIFGTAALEIEPSLDKLIPRRQYAGMTVITDEEQTKKTTEKAIINKIMLAQKQPVKSSPKKFVAYMSAGCALIRLPSFFNLPDLVIGVNHYEKPSTFGEENTLTVYQRLDTATGYSWVPVALIQDNPLTTALFKKVFAGTPAEENLHLIKKDALEVRVQNNTLFAGWTVQIPLFPKQLLLPPACLLMEGIGQVTTEVQHVSYQSGFKTTNEFNAFNAFVTFIHPASKYSGPGTDGVFARDLIITTTPPTKDASSAESAS
jgi:sugar-specific transcriptional regulator TrmB